MRRGLLPLALLLPLLPLRAQAAELWLEVENVSTRVVEMINVYPADPDGTVIEDVTASLMDPLPPGKTARLRLAEDRSDCGHIFVRLRFAGGEEVEGRTDTCRNTRLLATD